MNRRGFLGGLAGILAAGVAPAIVHNPMKIVVPKKDLIYSTNLCQEIVGFDFVSKPGIYMPDLSEWISNQGYVREKLIDLLVVSQRSAAHAVLHPNDWDLHRPSDLASDKEIDRIVGDMYRSPKRERTFS